MVRCLINQTETFTFILQGFNCLKHWREGQKKKTWTQGYTDIATDQSNSVGIVEAKLFNVNDANSNKFYNDVVDSN